MIIDNTTTRDDLKNEINKQDSELVEIIKKLYDVWTKKTEDKRSGKISAMDFLLIWIYYKGENDKGNPDYYIDLIRNVIKKEPSTYAQNWKSFFFENCDGGLDNTQKKLINTILQSNDVQNIKNSLKAAAGIKQNAETLLSEIIKEINEYNSSVGAAVIPTNPLTQHCVDLLLANKQLILNGAPGTGKTYMAKNELASGLGIITDEDKSFRIHMVQFHPSYDYTDFIDGIRPNLDNGNLSYTLKNGSFKEFCRKAGVYERMTAAGKPINAVEIKNFLNPDGESAESKFWMNQELIEKYNNSKDLPPFLFIIDEINRAEISKVLGEVMFCLDPDYRGEKGKIKTQYSNSATAETFFVDEKDDYFFIPSNVYIVATMNDIDRSVEVFDFALRRRFAWYEVKAADVMDNVLSSMKVDTELNKLKNDCFGTYTQKIANLNDAIINDLHLSRHYHLGPAYFAKITNYISNGFNKALEQVWENHISQILYEYVKGKHGLEAEIDKMKEKFLE